MDARKEFTQGHDVHDWMVQAIIDMQNVVYQKDVSMSEELNEPTRKIQENTLPKPPASYKRKP
jgi:hypothetical protein